MSDISNTDYLTSQREVLFINLYKQAFPAVAKYVSKMGGTFDEAKDVFHDALVIYCEKTTTASALKNDTAYLVGIAKHLWLKRYRENSNNMPLDDWDLGFDVQEDHPSAKRLFRFLETSGKKCMELLKSFYYDQLPLTDIAAVFGYSGVRSATVQKYKCLEKVRETIKQKALQYEDFME
jgi:DNA-directed RNA polymerase specialized sigma24 family protein